MSQLRYWIWLSTLRGVRPITAKRLFDHFGSPMDIFFADREKLSAVSDITDSEMNSLILKDLTPAEHVLKVCDEKDIRILTIQDATYPERLRQIADPPLILYVRGSIPFVDELPAIAVVGTRKCTPYGVKIALQLGNQITACGGSIVTGLALGIDAAAARGALQKGGCIGVLGTAIDVDYPKENASLIQDVAAVGSVISEFPPGYPTMSENFPRRNRIISGLSVGTCVVEAPLRSGALYTANFALEQGRDLFAVPGNIDSENSMGCNALIRDCARAVTCGWDILSEYEGLFSCVHSEGKSQIFPPAEEAPKPSATKSVIDKPTTIPYIDLESRWEAYSDPQKALLRCLSIGPRQIDTLIAETGLPSARVLADMTILTIRGAVTALPGKRYELNLK